MPRYALRIAYDGTRFHGWQRQDNVPTIQGAIEAALTRMNGGTPIALDGASRTDAGVHAQGQLAAFTYDGRLSANDFVRGLNALTPDAIAIRSVTPAPDDFHPRFASAGKRYRYTLWLHRVLPPHLAPFVWSPPRPVQLDLMRDAADALIGEHDFAAFRASDCEARTTTRTIWSIQLDTAPAPYDFPTPDEAQATLHITLEGNAFLKNMVRIIAGTLYEIGAGVLPPDTARRALDARDRTLAGRTAPASGLTLVRVFLPGDRDEV